jgi:hypothetical protein
MYALLEGVKSRPTSSWAAPVPAGPSDRRLLCCLYLSEDTTIQDVKKAQLAGMLHQNV